MINSVGGSNTASTAHETHEGCAAPTGTFQKLGVDLPVATDLGEHTCVPASSELWRTWDFDTVTIKDWDEACQRGTRDPRTDSHHFGRGGIDI